MLRSLLACALVLGLAGTARAKSSEQPENAAPLGTEQTFIDHSRFAPFWFGAEMNTIFQTHPGFSAPYTGDHSVTPGPEADVSGLFTVFFAYQPHRTTEIILDAEMALGTGISQAVGIAGFTNLDVVRNPTLSSEPYVARFQIHQMIPLSSEWEENDERGPLTSFKLVPRHRLELRLGKMSTVDIFDINPAGSDSHRQFMNWTVDNNGAWDYAADTRGYTVGFTADYEDRTWAFRFAEGLMPKVANGIDLVWKVWQAHGENFEYELRHGVWPRKSGTIRLLAYTNAASMGIYRNQIIKAAASGTTPSITDHPWQITRKYGFGVNLEQNLTRYLTAFARFGWNNGKTESFAYTEVDQTLDQGIGANGKWWHRKQDRAGVAFVSNAIKKDHQNYLLRSGLGFLLGDGHLTYGRENILEAYYTLHAWRGIYVAPGVQHINNPGYNRDRGPVLVPSFRLHVEF
jgi:high affinity Mn2+ porin